MMNNEIAAELRSRLSDYAVHGGRYFAVKPEIVALSVVYLRQTKAAAYRIATLADGARALAVRYARKGAQWKVVR